MVQIKVERGSGKIHIKSDGHANYAKHGSDIVCAGISAILETTVLGLTELAIAYPDYVSVDIEEEG